MGPTREGDFTLQAEAYARARPPYPERIVDDLMTRAAVRPGQSVVELGSGTGLFTELLAARGLHVTAIEPSAAMRQLAPELPGVLAKNGTFENTGLASNSQSWAVAAQAFHWADPRRALPEIRRVLNEGAWFSVLWNDRDEVASDVLRWTMKLIVGYVPGFDEAYRNRDWASVLVGTGDFEGPIEDEVRHVVVMSAQRYLDLWRSHNRLNAAAGPTNMARLLRAIEERLRVEHVGRIDVPYVCRAWSCRRAR